MSQWSESASSARPIYPNPPMMPPSHQHYTRPTAKLYRPQGPSSFARLHVYDHRKGPRGPMVVPRAPDSAVVASQAHDALEQGEPEVIPL
jgi:hypothetical protein